MRLDRSTQPVRFAVATSVLSGLAVTAVTAGVGLVFTRNFLVYRIPIWTLLVLVALLGSLMLWVAPTASGRHQVFLIVPAFSQKHWFAELIQNLHNSLDRRQFDLVLKGPDRDYVSTGQVHHLRTLRKQRRGYAGGVFIAAEPWVIRRDLVSFCASVSYPLVFVDVEPFDELADYPSNSAFVGCSADAIGQRAAIFIAEEARKSSIDSPGVLVVGSQTQKRRQSAFVEELKLRLARAEVVVDDDGDFVRTRAREVVRRNLRVAAMSGIDIRFIFCTSDELALGAVDAIHAARVGDGYAISVVGVDGTPEVRALIDSGGTPLQATVTQDSYRIAEVAVELLSKKARHEAASRTYFKPGLYTRES